MLLKLVINLLPLQPASNTLSSSLNVALLLVSFEWSFIFHQVHVERTLAINPILYTSEPLRQYWPGLIMREGKERLLSDE